MKVVELPFEETPPPSLLHPHIGQGHLLIPALLSSLKVGSLKLLLELHVVIRLPRVGLQFMRAVTVLLHHYIPRMLHKGIDLLLLVSESWRFQEGWNPKTYYLSQISHGWFPLSSSCTHCPPTPAPPQEFLPSRDCFRTFSPHLLSSSI